MVYWSLTSYLTSIRVDKEKTEFTQEIPAFAALSKKSPKGQGPKGTPPFPQERKVKIILSWLYWRCPELLTPRSCSRRQSWCASTAVYGTRGTGSGHPQGREHHLRPGGLAACPRSSQPATWAPKCKLEASGVLKTICIIGLILHEAMRRQKTLKGSQLTGRHVCSGVGRHIFQSP